MLTFFFFFFSLHCLLNRNRCHKRTAFLDMLYNANVSAFHLNCPDCSKKQFDSVAFMYFFKICFSPVIGAHVDCNNKASIGCSCIYMRCVIYLCISFSGTGVYVLLLGVFFVLSQENQGSFISLNVNHVARRHRRRRGLRAEAQGNSAGHCEGRGFSVQLTAS